MRADEGRVQQPLARAIVRQQPPPHHPWKRWIGGFADTGPVLGRSRVEFLDRTRADVMGITFATGAAANNYPSPACCGAQRCPLESISRHSDLDAADVRRDTIGARLDGEVKRGATSAATTTAATTTAATTTAATY